MVIEGLASHIPITDTASAHLHHSHQSQTMNGKQMVISRLASHILNTQQNQSQTQLPHTKINQWRKMVIHRLTLHISNTQQNQSQTGLESTSITLTTTKRRTNQWKEIATDQLVSHRIKAHQKERKKFQILLNLTTQCLTKTHNNSVTASAKPASTNKQHVSRTQIKRGKKQESRLNTCHRPFHSVLTICPFIKRTIGLWGKNKH